MKIWNSVSALVAMLVGVLVIAGCGGSSGKSASAAATTTAATTPATTTTPVTTSTAAKHTSTTPAKTTPTKTTTTPSKPPAAKASVKAKEAQGFGKIKLSSTAFKSGGPIAIKYTCDGSDTSPPLEWHGVPHDAAELFLLAIDLSGSSGDAIQWAVAIPPTVTSLPEGGLPAGAVAGRNSEGNAGWGGICGTKGRLHHVGFLFFALNHKLGLKAGFNPISVRSGLKGSTLATGLTLATYQRP